MAMLKKPRLNNITLFHFRREPLYEAIMTDLVLMGALDKRTVEAFTGIEIPSYLKPPAGYTTARSNGPESDE